MTLKYRQALLQDVQSQIEPLAKQHLQETDKRLSDFADVEVNFDVYKDLEKQGLFTIFVAEEQGDVKAFLSFYIVETPHITGFRQGICDALYVHKEARKHGAAQELIKRAEQYAKEMACNYITLCFKANNPHKRFCNSIGYQEDDIMYSKSFDV